MACVNKCVLNFGFIGVVDFVIVIVNFVFVDFVIIDFVLIVAVVFVVILVLCIHNIYYVCTNRQQYLNIFYVHVYNISFGYVQCWSQKKFTSGHCLQ